MKSILFIGGLNSTGNKAKFIKSYLSEKNKEVKLEVITPNYILEDASSICENISRLLSNNYDFIIASSTGGLFLLSVLDRVKIKPSRIIFINPLFSISENLLQHKDRTFLDIVNPMMMNLRNNKLEETMHKFTFFLSENDEVIGSQKEAIARLKFPSSKRIITINDNHRFSSSMNVIGEYILNKMNLGQTI